MKKTLLFLSIAAMMLAVGCKKEDENGNKETANVKAFAYLLHEGGQDANNASLSMFTADETLTNNFFANKNGRPLGALAQDIIQYGSKIYITVSGSGTIEVIDAATGSSVKQITLGNSYPRYLTADGGKIYASCYYPRSVVRIDTASFDVEASCPLSGLNPEGICIAGGNIYVCNSYVQNEDNSFSYDSTLSVVSLATFTETERVKISLNPQQVIALDNGKLVVSYSGDNIMNPSGIAIYDPATATAVHATGFPVIGITVNGNTIYAYGSAYDENWNPTPAINTINIATLEVNPFVSTATSQIKTPYGMSVNPATGNLYIADATDYTTNGDLYCINPDGTLVWKKETSILPKKMCFVK